LSKKKKEKKKGFNTIMLFNIILVVIFMMLLDQLPSCNVESRMDHLSGSITSSVFKTFKLSEIVDDKWFRRMIFEMCVCKNHILILCWFLSSLVTITFIMVHVHLV
jgi:hypothetical protein